MNTTTRNVVVGFLWSYALVTCATNGHAQMPVHPDSFKFEDRGLPVLGIWDLQHNAVVPGVDPRLTIAVWKDGFVVFSEALLEGEPYHTRSPLRKGRCDHDLVRACLDTLDSCKFFEREKTNCYGPDGNFMRIHAITADRFQLLRSWHDLNSKFGQPDDEFKRVWDCAKEAILQLVPRESEPVDRTTWEVLHAWSPVFSEMAGAIGPYGKTVKAIEEFAEHHAAPPESFQDLVPEYLDKVPGQGRGITCEYVPEVGGSPGATKEWQVQIRYPPRKPGGFRRRTEWAIYRPSGRYPASFRGHKTHRYGGWAFTLYEPKDE